MAGDRAMAAKHRKSKRGLFPPESGVRPEKSSTECNVFLSP